MEAIVGNSASSFKASYPSFSHWPAIPGPDNAPNSKNCNLLGSFVMHGNGEETWGDGRLGIEELRRKVGTAVDTERCEDRDVTSGLGVGIGGSTLGLEVVEILELNFLIVPILFIAQ